MIYQGFFSLFTSSALLIVTDFFLIWIVLWLPIAIPLAIALKWRPSKSITPAQKLPLLASLYLLAPLVLWAAAAVEKRPFAAYGLPWHPTVLISFGIGLVLGTLGLVALFVVQNALGWVAWRSPQASEAPEPSTPKVGTILGLTLFLGIWVSITEELVFRGFLMNVLQRDYSPWVAAVVASFIFALLHLVWEGTDNIPQLPGLWLMGMVLVLARWVDNGSLGLAWGLHSGWVWAIASLDSTQLLSYTNRVPAWVTGLGGKPLAGVMGILFLLATGVALWAVGF